MNDVITTTLRNYLEEKQRSEKLSDYAFAKKLKISRSTWQLTRTKQKAIGLTIIQAIARNYPELDTLILKYLREGANGQ